MPKRTNQWWQFTFCETHQKRGYFTRQSARAAIRMHHQGHKGIRPYKCDAGGAELWHLGHIPKIVRRRGIVDAETIFRAPYRKGKQ